MAKPHLPPLPDDIVDRLNANRGGYNMMIDLRFTEARYDEVVAKVPIRAGLLQPYGLVHGGVYASIVETVASTAAALHATAQGRSVVGLENATSFLRAAREGTLTARGRPLVTGRRSHVWEVAIESDDGKVAATGRVRLLCIEGGSAVAGAQLPTTLDASTPDIER